MIGIDSLQDHSQWLHLPSICERYTGLILAELDRFDVKATFFVLGWIAERYPQLIQSIAARGHEIGAHSHLHQTVYDLGPTAFAEDLDRCIHSIASVTGQVPRGYRAPSFSIVPGCEWAFDILLDMGFEYDASLFPAKRAHGGYPCPYEPHRQCTPSGRTIVELPMSTMRFLGREIGFSGGGYLRLFYPPASLHMGLITPIPEVDQSLSTFTLGTLHPIARRHECRFTEK